MIPDTLIHYIETEIIPRYQDFDKAHNLLHVQTVISESLALARQHPEVDERLVYTIAAYHDTGLCRDRATHHLVSGEILMADTTLRQWFSEEEIQTMREAVEDHRASTDHEPRSIYGRIVAEADRIIDSDITLRRPVLTVAPEGLFFRWMALRGKMGGQNKVPRLENSRLYADALRELMDGMKKD